MEAFAKSTAGKSLKRLHKLRKLKLLWMRSWVAAHIYWLHAWQIFRADVFTASPR